MSLHGMNFMDAVYTPPKGVARWWDVVRMAPGQSFVQRSLPGLQKSFRDYRHDPTIASWWLEEPTRWRTLGTERELTFEGRLVGGCADVISRLVGTPYGDVPGFARTQAQGTVLFLENCGMSAPDAARCWHQLVMAGWFEGCNGVLIGRTAATETDAYTQRQALEDAFAPLVRRGVPVVYDVDLGHQPPQLLFVQGATARVEYADGRGTLTQWLR
jgi:muramoyltetrapeptide carboxypeptidase LdcA involved in peptidoglycan recycling